MSDWKVITLGDCASFQEGYVNPSKNEPSYFGGTVKWLRATDLNNGFVYETSQTLTEKGFLSAKKSAVLFEPDSLAISKSGTIGRIGILKDYMCGNRAVINIKVNENICNPLFIFYTLLNSKEQIETLAEGSVQKNLYVSALSKVKLLLPDINKQKEIGYILNALDQKIELNTQINQTLEQIAQALFKSWFVDFDPVRAKVQALSDGMSLEQAELAAMQAISGKTPEELTALSQTQPDRYAELAETAKAFPCEMVEVDGSEVPKGWNLKALSDLGQIICGKTPSKSNKEFYGNDVPFIKIPDMHNQIIITQTTDNLSVAGANSQSKKYIPPKSICVSCIATVGLVSMTSKPSHTNQQINSIIPNDEQTSEFLYLSLKQSSMTKYLKDLASGGSATLNLNTSTFSKIEIMTPSKEIIDIFQNKVVSIFEKILSNSIENKKLSEIRDLLLLRLLNGEI